MFINLANIYQQPPDGLHTVLRLPATQLGRWIEEAWYNSNLGVTTFSANIPFGQSIEDIRAALGHPQPILNTPHGIRPSGLAPPLVGPPHPFNLMRPSLPGGLIWQHLIYAYLLESSGMFDIVAEVARRLVAGESLGTLRPASIVWLRNTEELFFRDPPLFGVAGVVSDLRPSEASNRRNTYWRMFGMDLPHQIPQRWPDTRSADAWKAHTAPGVDADFQEKLIELLRQVWMGIINNQNTNGPNPTDAAYIALLCTAIRDMLRNRRQNGMLAREEFVYVTTMSWFHLTLLDSGSAGNQNAPIIQDLQAQGTAPEQRLNNLAQKVGMKPAARSRELFQLCQVMSALLRAIELGTYDTAATAPLLYDDTLPNNFVPQMRDIVNLWQSATGQRIKDRDAVPSATTTTQPIRIPTPAGSVSGTAPSTNGSKDRT